MEIQILSAALILVASLCGGLSCVFISRSRSSINKHSRQRIKDFENDIKYLAESKKEEAAGYRKAIMRLKVINTKQQEGLTTITDKDMQNSGLGDVISQLIPPKYRKAASFLIPQVEEAVKKDPALIEKVYEKIKSANTASSKKAEPGTETEAVQSL